MLLTPELIERLADILEGIAVSHPHTGSQSEPGTHESSILVYHSGRPQSGTGPLAGESPLLEIHCMESATDLCVTVTSALGVVELHAIDEIRLLEATEEAAFFSHDDAGRISMLTLSSRGVLQVYLNLPESLADAELSDISDRDLRAAVALKIFAENSDIFRDEA